MSRIVTNTSANTVFKNYTRNQAALAGSTERLATGLRINRAGDDPAGLAISETLRAQIRGTDAGIDVIANGTNLINVADGYLQTVHDIVGRLEELAVAYTDGSKSATDLANLDAEFQELLTEGADIAANATFNGAQIFDGNDRVFQAGANVTDVFTTVAGAFDTFDISGADITDLSTIQPIIDAISTQRAALGASQSRLNFKALAQQNYSENVAAAESRIRNADIALESSKFARGQILVQSSTAMLAQANAVSQSVLQLLQ